MEKNQEVLVIFKFSPESHSAKVRVCDSDQNSKKNKTS